jgi:hypothetical protein
MDKVDKIDWEKFKELSIKLIKYKTKITVVPIKAMSWEEIIYTVLIYMEKKVVWSPGSHSKGIDLEIILNGENLNISAKAGKITRKTLSLSSYRLTRFGYLGDMLQFIRENAKMLDVYLICARHETKKELIYNIFRIDSKYLIPAKMLDPINWKETSSAWNLHFDVGFQARIVKKMSNQLWYSIPIDSKELENIATISIKKSDIGIMLQQILKNLDS